jgi:hypothetical protein
MLKRLFAMSLVVMALLSTIPVGATVYSSPADTVQAYYDAVNLKDYVAAYSFLAKPSQTYQQFIIGFSDTSKVDSYLGELQAADASGAVGRLPVVAVGHHTDGTLVSFFGCFNLHYSGGSVFTWLIDGSTLRKLGDFYPDMATITTYLAVNCFNDLSKVTINAASRAFGNEQLMLTAYYSLLNQRDYQNAYSYWLHPIPGPQPNGAPAQDYRTPYQTYISGYANTVYVSVYLGNYVYGGAAAGHSYLLGFIPAVLVGQQADGSFASYYGCYVIGQQQGLPFSNMGIVSGKFTLFANDAPSGSLISQYLATDCTTLGLKL